MKTVMQIIKTDKKAVRSLCISIYVFYYVMYDSFSGHIQNFNKKCQN